MVSCSEKGSLTHSRLHCFLLLDLSTERAAVMAKVSEKQDGTSLGLENENCGQT